MNKKTKYNKKDLQTAYQFVCDVIGRDIKTRSRIPHVVDGRTLFYMIALETTEAPYEAIAGVVDRNHSTVSHAIKHSIHFIKQDRELMGYYELYLKNYITESGKHKKAIADLKAYNDLLEDHRILLNMYNLQLLKDESSLDLTENEKQYRDLSEEEKSHYDSKASLVLKSFEWKRRDSVRKESFEIINVGM
tara:strand:+ start:714 stop:1286 length:573 start_codon:yes stop_codon:yes gene_type:complete